MFKSLGDDGNPWLRLSISPPSDISFAIVWRNEIKIIFIILRKFCVKKRTFLLAEVFRVKNIKKEELLNITKYLGNVKENHVSYFAIEATVYFFSIFAIHAVKAHSFRSRTTSRSRIFSVLFHTLSKFSLKYCNGITNRPVCNCRI